MNYKSLLISLFFFSIPVLAHAGFVVTSRSTAMAANKVVTVSADAQKSTATLPSLMQVKGTANVHPEDRHNVKGKIGTLAFVFGLCGFIPILGAGASIAAIVLGIIGMRKHQKHSLAGLILGIGTITLGIILTIIIFSSIVLY